MTRREQLAYMVGIIEHSGKGSHGLEQAIKFAEDNGIRRNMHVGQVEDWFNEDRDNRVAEWMMGQFLDMYESDSYLGFNSGINISHSFLDGDY